MNTITTLATGRLTMNTWKPSVRGVITDAQKSAKKHGGFVAKTSIQWTNGGYTWNPWQGCQKVSPGCDNCYMFRDKKRFGQNPEIVVRSKTSTFNRPLRWNSDAEKAGRVDLVFLASWADFFSKEADEWRAEAWAIIKRCPNLIFQILTKRHGRIADHLPEDWGEGYPNVWLGVSAEDATWWNRRVPELLSVPAQVHFVSYEPALGSIAGCSAAGIDWVIIGGESGPDARDFDIGWAQTAIDICKRDGAKPFLKQLGARPTKEVYTGDDDLGVKLVQLHLKDSHGGEEAEWPKHLHNQRHFPVTK